MTQPNSQIPTRITVTAAVLFSVLALWVNIYAQGSPGVYDSTKELFGWFLAAGGFITMLVGIVYGFAKKTKYDNIERERDEWKDIAESRLSRITEIQATNTLQQENLRLTVKTKDTKILNLEVSNEAVVSQNLQMKAILKRLRLDGQWQGHEEMLYLEE
jgi:hypothetical protein